MVYNLKQSKIDRRKKYILTLDVETANGLQYPLVYDLGFSISDKKGRIYEEGSFIIDEIWSQKNLMQSSYYAKKIPEYEKEIAQGLHKVVKFNYARTHVRKLVDKYNVRQVSAYNLKFDLGALNGTSYNLNRSAFSHFFSHDQRKRMEKVDIWTLACKTIFIQKRFSSFCLENGFVSEAGNFKTNAEVAYAFMKNDCNFSETHKGLADVKIEVEIMAHAYKQHKYVGDKYEWKPWKIINNHLKYGSAIK